MPTSRPVLGGGTRPSLAAALFLAVAVLAAAPAVSQAATPALAPAAPGVHNLLVNPNYDIDLSGWQLSGDVTWTNTLDSAGQNPASGAAVVHNPAGNVSELYQCVDLPLFWRSLDLGIDWHMLALTTSGASAVELLSYDAPDCPPVNPMALTQNLGFADPDWAEVIIPAVFPPVSARSVRVGLQGVNPDPTTSSTAVVDTIFFGYTIEPGTCGKDPTLLCLDHGRFQITAQFSQTCGNGNGNQAAGVADNAAGGFFWCFDPGNPEVFVKVLDACTPLTGDTYWVFLSGLTNLGVQVTVTDTVTGMQRTYSSAAGANFQPIFDTQPGLAVCP